MDGVNHEIDRNSHHIDPALVTQIGNLIGALAGASGKILDLPREGLSDSQIEQIEHVQQDVVGAILRLMGVANPSEEAINSVALVEVLPPTLNGDSPSTANGNGTGTAQSVHIRVLDAASVLATDSAGDEIQEETRPPVPEEIETFTPVIAEVSASENGKAPLDAQAEEIKQPEISPDYFAITTEIPIIEPKDPEQAIDLEIVSPNTITINGLSITLERNSLLIFNTFLKNPTTQLQITDIIKAGFVYSIEIENPQPKHACSQALRHLKKVLNTTDDTPIIISEGMTKTRRHLLNPNVRVTDSRNTSSSGAEESDATPPAEAPEPDFLELTEDVAVEIRAPSRNEDTDKIEASPDQLEINVEEISSNIIDVILERDNSGIVLDEENEILFRLTGKTPQDKFESLASLVNEVLAKIDAGHTQDGTAREAVAIIRGFEILSKSMTSLTETEISLTRTKVSQVINAYLRNILPKITEMVQEKLEPLSQIQQKELVTEGLYGFMLYFGRFDLRRRSHIDRYCFERARALMDEILPSQPVIEAEIPTEVIDEPLDYPEEEEPTDGVTDLEPLDSEPTHDELPLPTRITIPRKVHPLAGTRIATEGIGFDPIKRRNVRFFEKEFPANVRDFLPVSSSPSASNAELLEQLTPKGSIEAKIDFLTKLTQLTVLRYTHVPDITQVANWADRNTSFILRCDEELIERGLEDIATEIAENIGKLYSAVLTPNQSLIRARASQLHARQTNSEISFEKCVEAVENEFMRALLAFDLSSDIHTPVAKTIINGINVANLLQPAGVGLGR